MSDFKFSNGYKFSVYPHEDCQIYNDDFSFDVGERVEIDGVDFIRERTCTIEKTIYGWGGKFDSYILSCGHVCREDRPKYCLRCGAKVVEE